MKKYISIIIIPFILFATILTASFYESYDVQVKILSKLSDKTTKRLLKKYNFKLKHNVGVKVKVIQSKAKDYSHTTKRLKKGQEIEIVISTEDESLLKKIKKGNILSLTYTYEDDETDDGLYESKSWVLEK